MNIDSLLGLLTKVKKTSARHFVAICPAHDDHSPSLAIREKPDGTILLHCFAGCTVDDICNALGVSIGALFPNRGVGSRPPVKGRFDPAQILVALAHEATVLVLISEALHTGRALTSEMAQRLDLAAGRINAALQFVTVPESSEMRCIRRGDYHALA